MDPLTPRPPEIHRTSLEWARDIARSYRWALKAVDPEKCAKLDEQAVALGQRWIAPTVLPAEAVPDAMDAKLAPKDIEQFWGIPAGTMYGWASKGLLTNYGKKGAPLYLVSEVFAVNGRRRTA